MILKGSKENNEIFLEMLFFFMKSEKPNLNGIAYKVNHHLGKANRTGFRISGFKDQLYI